MNKLYEYYSPERAKLLVEHDGNSRDLYMTGIFVQANVKNQNQRVYPLREIESAVKRIDEQIKNGFSIFGEADHPSELNINLDRISHMITNMWMQGDDGYGKLKIIDTPCGLIVRKILEAGGKLGVSSRGSGNVGHDGVVSDFEMVTVDIVAQPSAPNAYPKSIYESLYNMRGGAMMFETARDASGGDQKANIAIAKEIQRFLSDLKKM